MGWRGIQAIKTLDDSLQNPQELAKFAEKLQALHNVLCHAPHEFLLIGEAEHQDQFIQELSQVWSSASAANQKLSPFDLHEQRQQVKQAWLTSTQVNFAAKAYPTVPLDHEDAAALAVLAPFMRNGFLHRVIREQGGAYGGGASADADIAAFRFYSYRDPRLQETLDDFDHAIDWMLNEKHEWAQVEEAILGVIGSMDRPSSPAGEAKKAFFGEQFGRTKAQRQRMRENVLKVTLEDLQRVTQTYLDKEKASIGVISNAEHESILAKQDVEIHHL